MSEAVSSNCQGWFLAQIHRLAISIFHLVPSLYSSQMPNFTPSDNQNPAPAWSSDELSTNPHVRNDKAGKVQRMFAAIAGSYDLNNRIHSFGLDQRWRKKVVRLAGDLCGKRVLDVACGTGDLAEAFAMAGPEHVEGIDFTPEMLDIARKRPEKTGSSPLTWRVGDAMDLDVPDQSVDVVSIAFGLRNVLKPKRALAEFKRVLKPDGKVLILEFSEPTNPVIRGFNRLYTNHIMPLTASVIARDRSGAYRYLPKSVETFLSRAEIQSALQSCGFRNVRQIPMTFGVCVAYVADAG